MVSTAKAIARKALRKLGYDTIRTTRPCSHFHGNHYLRHNARRLEHLASLRIPVAGMKVLEVGAGIGDHSHYYLDRGCRITITDARLQNLRHLRRLYSDQDVQYLDMERPTPLDNAPYDIIHCYGLLYHLSNPELALEFLSRNCEKILFLETCVTFGDTKEINLTAEKQDNPTQSYSGTGCRPTRSWIFEKLQRFFEYVYVPNTQPNHEQFPLDWAAPEKHQASLSRSIFIASRDKLENQMLSPLLIRHQSRHP